MYVEFLPVHKNMSDQTTPILYLQGLHCLWIILVHKDVINWDTPFRSHKDAVHTWSLEHAHRIKRSNNFFKMHTIRAGCFSTPALNEDSRVLATRRTQVKFCIEGCIFRDVNGSKFVSQIKYLAFSCVPIGNVLLPLLNITDARICSAQTLNRAC